MKCRDNYRRKPVDEPNESGEVRSYLVTIKRLYTLVGFLNFSTFSLCLRPSRNTPSLTGISSGWAARCAR